MCVGIDIVDDDYKEDNESFVFALCPEDDEAHIDDFYARVYIIDDDSKLCTAWVFTNHMTTLASAAWYSKWIFHPVGVTVSLSLGNPLGFVNEGRGTMLVLVEVEGSLKTDITVTVETSDGTGKTEPVTLSH